LVRGKIFCTGPTGAAKAGEKSFVPAQRAEQTNQRRSTFICLHLPQFQQSAGAIPLYSRLSGYRSGAGLGGYVANSNNSKKALFFYFPISCLFEHLYMVADNSPFYIFC
jgi:hypothetical protein